MAGLVPFVYAFRRYALISDISEDGPRLASINAWQHGLDPFRDFVVQYGYLQEVLKPKLAFIFWDVDYAALLRMNLAFSAIAAGLCFLIVRELVEWKGLVLVIGLLLLWRTDWVLAERSLFALLALFCLCRSLRRPQTPHWSLAAGVSAMAALLYSFEIGVTLVAGIAVWFAAMLAVERRFLSILKPFTIGAGSVAGAFLLVLLYHGGFSHYFLDLADRLRYGAALWSEGLKSSLFTFDFLQGEIAFERFFAVHGAPLAALLFLIYRVIERTSGRERATDPAALLIGLTLFFQFLIYLGHSGHRHVLNSTSLRVPVLALFLSEALHWLHQPRAHALTPAVAALLFAIVVPPVWAGLSGGTPILSWVVNGATLRVFTPPADPSTDIERLGPVSMDAAHRTRLRTLVAWIQKEVPPDGTLFDLSQSAHLYFLANRKNAARATIVDAICGERMVQECLRQLETRRPDAILVTLTKNGFRKREDLQPIHSFVESHYQEKYRLEDTALWVPKSPRPPVSPSPRQQTSEPPTR
jgi:hypothetical protein